MPEGDILKRFKNATVIKVEEKEDGSIELTAIGRKPEPIVDKNGNIIAYKLVSTEK